MAKTVVGLFGDETEARRAVSELQSSGFTGNDVTMTPAADPQTAIEVMSAAAIPEKDLRVYAEAVRRGGILVLVHTENQTAQQAADILAHYRLVDAGTRPDGNGQSSVNSIRLDRPDVVVGTRGYDMYDADFRKHFQKYYADRGYTYNQYAPPYRYGYNLAVSPRTRGKDWHAIEAGARRTWEERNPGTWDQIKDGVQYAWERTRGIRQVP